ncbi:MAG: cupredoxin domain-containing protein [Solirubrobacterales bacterium]
MRKARSNIGFAMRRPRWLVVLSLAALGMLALGLSACGGGNSSGEASANTPPATPAPESAAPENVKVVVKSDEEHGKKGSDGNWHDAFLPSDFSVKAGATVSVTVYNYDDMPHSFTAPELGTNAQIPGGSEDKPSKTTFTFKAPDKAGSYEWICVQPCDPWAMTHDGFMKGYVTVT